MSDNVESLDDTSDVTAGDDDQATGYSYGFAPYVSDSSWQTLLGAWGSDVGGFVGSAAAGIFKPLGPAGELIAGAVTSKSGSEIGSEIGRDAGWVIDNFSNLESNFKALQREINDYRTWLSPDLNK